MKVNDYVRTKNGIIGRIETKNYIGYSDWLIDTFYYNDDEIINGWTCGIKEYNIIKSSPNIIDLIEVGDYVNGYIVNEITDIDTGQPVLCNFDLNTMRWTPLEEIDIWYSIVTKEQFESTEYRIGE